MPSTHHASEKPETVDDLAADALERSRLSHLQALQKELGVPAALTIRLDEEEIDRRVDAFLGRGTLAYATNTMKAFRADWTVWCGYCDAHQLDRLPVSAQTLERFLDARITGAFTVVGAKPVGKTRATKAAAGMPAQPSVDAYCTRATLERYLSTLRKAHRLVGLPFEGDTFDGELIIRSQLRRLFGRQQQKEGLTHEHVLQMDRLIDPSKLTGLRDRALLWMQYSALARRSEVVALRIEDIKHDVHAGHATVLLSESKVDQDGIGALLFLRAEAATAVQAWLSETGLTRGPILRALQVPGRRAYPGADSKKLSEQECPAPALMRDRKLPNGIKYAMTDHHVARVLKRLAKQAGLASAIFSGHSARIGGAQDMSAAGISKAQIMQAGRWKSERQVARYTESVDAGRSAGAELAKLQEKAAKKD